MLDFLNVYAVLGQFPEMRLSFLFTKLMKEFLYLW